MGKIISARIRDRVQGANTKLGVPVKLPTPTPKQQQISGIVAMLLGTGFALTGIAVKHKWSTISGVAIIVGGVLSYRDAKK